MKHPLLVLPALASCLYGTPVAAPDSPLPGVPTLMEGGVG